MISSDLSTCLNIPKEIVAPLLEILEKMESPCPMPIRKASTLPIDLVPLLINFVANIITPLIIKPKPSDHIL